MYAVEIVQLLWQHSTKSERASGDLPSVALHPLLVEYVDQPVCCAYMLPSLQHEHDETFQSAPLNQQARSTRRPSSSHHPIPSLIYQITAYVPVIFLSSRMHWAMVLLGQTVASAVTGSGMSGG